MELAGFVAAASWLNLNTPYYYSSPRIFLAMRGRDVNPFAISEERKI
jgi:hypothetical protein